jgi:toxin HigB-1
MIVSFNDEGTRDIWHGDDTRAARRTCPSTLWPVAFRKLLLLDRAERLEHLRVPGGNQLERLEGDRAGQYSIRINRQYRVCFWWIGAGAAAVEIADYH